MKKIFLEYLFHHNCLVSPAVTPGENIPELRFALARLFSIRITSGAELLRLEMIPMISNFLGTGVPAPFYRGFPDSIRELSVPELVIDQYLHYYRTYGLGDFSAAGHSVFEKEVERKCFREKTEVRDFSVLTETEAAAKLTEYAEGLLAGTRPLSDDQYGFLLDFLLEYHYHPKNCASKSTAFRLLADTGDLYYTGFLMLSDVTKMAEELNFRRKAEKISKDRADFDKKSKMEKSRSVFRLDLPNCDREFIRLANKLEAHYRDMQDMEFTIQEGKLYFLQTRNGKRTAEAAINIACDLVDEGMITPEEALLRIEAKSLDQLLHPTFDKDALAAGKVIGHGLPASPGAWA